MCVWGGGGGGGGATDESYSAFSGGKQASVLVNLQSLQRTREYIILKFL